MLFYNFLWFATINTHQHLVILQAQPQRLKNYITMLPATPGVGGVHNLQCLMVAHFPLLLTA